MHVNRAEIRTDEHRSIDTPRVTMMNLQIKLRCNLRGRDYAYSLQMNGARVNRSMVGVRIIESRFAMV